MIGGVLLGVIEALGAAYISVAWKDAIAFLVLILILIFRPTGLLGERVATSYEQETFQAFLPRRRSYSGFTCFFAFAAFSCLPHGLA